MSTMEIVCARCDKKFRVRSESAGRSTRCPGCSAPITIGNAPRAAAPEPRPSQEERPKPRPKPREDDDDAPRRRTLNWGSTEQAFRREQLTVIFSFVGVLGAFVTFCLGQMARTPMMGDDPFLMIIMLIFGVGPLLATSAFGLAARVSAVTVPSETLAKGSAIASLLSAIAGMLSLVVLVISIMNSYDNQGHDGLPSAVATCALLLSGLVAALHFAGFTAQVGIYQRSPAAVSRGIAHWALQR